MELQDLAVLIAGMLRDEVNGTVEVDGTEITVTFIDGVVKKVFLK